MEVNYLNSDQVEDFRLSSYYSREISMTISDKKYVAKLTIWPSRQATWIPYRAYMGASNSYFGI